MNQTENKDLKEFRKEAIDNLEKLRSSYMSSVDSSEDENDDRIKRLERAIRLFPALLKTEENFRISLSESERRERLEKELEPLFRVLRQELGAEFDRKREDILEALEAELKSNGAWK